MATLEELVVKLRADTDVMRRDIGQARKMVESSSKNMQGSLKQLADNSSKSFFSMKRAAEHALGYITGTLATKAFAALSGAVTSSAKSFQEFDIAVAEINSIMGKNAQVSDQLRAKFVKLSSEFGGEPQQQAKAFYQIISAGITDATAATQLLEIANRASTAGITDQTTAIDALTNVLATYSSKGMTAQQASDILFKTVQLGKTTFEELANNIGKVSPIASAAGVSFEDLSGALGYLTKVGLSTDVAATALRTALVAFVKPTEEARKVAQKFGIDLSTQAIKTKGFRGALQDIIEKTGGSEAALAKLFPDVQGLTAVLAIAKGNTADFNATLDATNVAAGATGEAFDRISGSSAFQLKVMAQEVQNLGLEFFETLQPAVKSFIDGSRDILNSLKGNEEGIKTFIKFLGVLADMLDYVSRGAQMVFNVIDTSLKDLAANAATVGAILEGNFAGALEIVKQRSKESKEELNNLFPDEGIFAKIGDGLRKSADEMKTTAEDHGTAAGSIIAQNQSVAGSADEIARALASQGVNAAGTVGAMGALQEAQQAYIEQSANFANQLLSTSEMEKLKLEELKILRDEELVSLEEFYGTQLEMLQNKQADERTKLQEALDAGKIDKTKHDAAMTQLDLKHANELTKINQEKNNAIDKQNEDAANKEKKRKEEMKAASMSALNELASLQNSKSKEMAAVGKAAAIAQTTISTFEGAQKAASALVGIPVVGPGLAIGAAAAFIASGLARVAQIRGTPLKTGIDSVPGIGSQDNFPAILAPRERVVPSETNKDLTRFLKDQGKQAARVVNNITVQVQGNIFDRRETGLAIVEALNEVRFMNGAQPI